MRGTSVFRDGNVMRWFPPLGTLPPSMPVLGATLKISYGDSQGFFCEASASLGAFDPTALLRDGFFSWATDVEFEIVKYRATSETLQWYFETVVNCCDSRVMDVNAFSSETIVSSTKASEKANLVFTMSPRGQVFCTTFNLEDFSYLGHVLPTPLRRRRDSPVFDSKEDMYASVVDEGRVCPVFSQTLLLAIPPGSVISRFLKK